MKNRRINSKETILDALSKLVADANRVCYKYGGHEEDGVFVESDYSEWKDLKTSISKAREVLKRHR